MRCDSALQRIAGLLHDRGRPLGHLAIIAHFGGRVVVGRHHARQLAPRSIDARAARCEHEHAQDRERHGRDDRRGCVGRDPRVVRVVGAETVREPSGLALSSRNSYLDEDQRWRAAALSRTLFAARAAARQR